MFSTLREESISSLQGIFVIVTAFFFFFFVINISICRSLEHSKLDPSLAAYENDVFTRAEPSVMGSRRACLDAHEFSSIANSPLVTERSLKR